MIKIQKNKDGFLIIENKGAIWAIEEADDSADFLTKFNEKKSKKSKIKIFDWPGEYEKKGAEIKGTEISEKGSTAFLGKIDGRKILTLSSNFDGFKNEKFDKIDDEADIFIVNILENTDINILVQVIEKSGAKIVIFSGEMDRIKEKIKDIKVEIELKITTIPEEKVEYFQI